MSATYAGNFELSVYVQAHTIFVYRIQALNFVVNATA